MHAPLRTTAHICAAVRELRARRGPDGDRTVAPRSLCSHSISTLQSRWGSLAQDSAIEQSVSSHQWIQHWPRSHSWRQRLETQPSRPSLEPPQPPPRRRSEGVTSVSMDAVLLDDRPGPGPPRRPGSGHRASLEQTAGAGPDDPVAPPRTVSRGWVAVAAAMTGSQGRPSLPPTRQARTGSLSLPPTRQVAQRRSQGSIGPVPVSRGREGTSEGVRQQAALVDADKVCPFSDCTEDGGCGGRVVLLSSLPWGRVGAGCRYRVPGQPLLNRHQVGGVSRSPDGLFAQQEREPIRGRPTVTGKRTYGGRPGQGVEEQGTWAAQKHSEAGYGQPVDRGVWTAKTVKRPRQQPAHPQYANYWAPLTRKRHTMPHSAQPQHTNYWAPRTRKRHQQEHRPQRPTESSDPTQHAKGRTGDRPGPRKGATTRRNVTQGGLPSRLSERGVRLYALVCVSWRKVVCIGGGSVVGG